MSVSSSTKYMMLWFMATVPLGQSIIADKTANSRICWSARDGGIDFMLATSFDAPNEFGLLNRSKKWQFMLLLSDAHDDLATPGLDADDEGTAVLARGACLRVHFAAAHRALQGAGFGLGGLDDRRPEMIEEEFLAGVRSIVKTLLAELGFELRCRVRRQRR